MHKELVRIKIYNYNNRPVITYVIGQLQSIILYYTYYKKNYIFYIHLCNRLVSKYIISHATNWQNTVYMSKVTACMFRNKLLLVCPLCEHLTCNRLGCPAAVGFHTQHQLSCTGCTKESILEYIYI